MLETEKKKAVSIGVICITTYLVNYYLRHLLSVLTPQMLENGQFTVEYIGILSSTYMVFYAAGQLINGFLGDILSPKKLVFCGISVASLVSVGFPFVNVTYLQVLCFAVLGFALSMVRGPLMKIISENTKPNYARTICVFFSFSSFAGPLVASLFAFVFDWREAFVAAGILGIVMAVCAYVVLSIMERKNMLSYRSAKGRGFGGFLDVFKIEKFAYYLVVACLVEIGATSVSFWIPTYLTESLAFPKATANMIFSGISVARAFMPFVALVIFRLTKERAVLMMRFSFSITAVMFAFMMLAGNKWLSIGLLVLALMSLSCSSALLWSIYIPGLGKTGKVSSINGILDCIGYVAAAASNILFAGTMKSIGWNGIFVLWAAIGVIGVVATLLVKDRD